MKNERVLNNVWLGEGGMQLQCFALAVQQILIGIKSILN